VTDISADIEAFRQALDRSDLAAVQSMLGRVQALLTAPVGYGGCGPLTRVAECRGTSPTPERLALARWLIGQGADIHEGGDAPLMRAALCGERLPMMALLIELGADVNARYGGNFPMLFVPCETQDPLSLAWLLDHGAQPAGALDYLLGGYLRSSRLATCVECLLAAGATTRFDLPGVMDLLRGRLDALDATLDADPGLVHRPLAGLDIGATGARRLTLDGATLLHVAAEFGRLDAAALLVARGADVNAAALTGQTPLFHSATQFDDAGLAMTEWLLAQGADPHRRARLPGHYERPEEFVEADVIGYAECFPGEDFPGSNAATLAVLRR